MTYIKVKLQWAPCVMTTRSQTLTMLKSRASVKEILIGEPVYLVTCLCQPWFGLV